MLKLYDIKTLLQISINIQTTLVTDEGSNGFKMAHKKVS